LAFIIQARVSAIYATLFSKTMESLVNESAKELAERLSIESLSSKTVTISLLYNKEKAHDAK
jgi:hypothetical protein